MFSFSRDEWVRHNCHYQIHAPLIGNNDDGDDDDDDGDDDDNDDDDDREIHDIFRLTFVKDNYSF